MVVGVRVYDKRIKKVGVIQSVKYYDPVDYYQRIFGSWPNRNFDSINVRFDGENSDTIYNGESCANLQLESATAGSTYSKLVLWHDFEETAGTVIGDWKGNVHSENKPASAPATKEISEAPSGDSGTYPSANFSIGTFYETTEVGNISVQTGNTYSEQDGTYEATSATLGTAANSSGPPAQAFNSTNPNGGLYEYSCQFPQYAGGAGAGQYNGNADKSGTGYKGGWLMIKLPVKILLTSYEISKRADASTSGGGRDQPRDHRVFGSNDGSTWTQVAELAGFTGNWGLTKTITANPGGVYYQYYLLVVNRVIQSNQCNIARWFLKGTKEGSSNTDLTWPPQNFPANLETGIRYFDDNMSEGRHIVEGSTLSNDEFGAYKAFTDSANWIDTYKSWKSGSNYSNGTYTGSLDESGTGYLGDWLKIQMPSAITLSQYTMKADSSLHTIAPEDFKLFGSNDDSTWTLLDTQTSLSWTSAESKTFNISPSSSYDYYMIIVNKSSSSTNTAIRFVTFEGATASTATGSVLGTRCLTYDGTTQYALGGVTNMPSDKMSISFWIKTTATEGTIFSFGGGGSNNVERAVKLSTGKVQLFEKNEAAETSLLSANTVNDNNWHYITCTIAGISSAWKIYVDSIDVSASAVNGPGNTNLAVTQTTIAVSYVNATLSNYYAGSIDDLRVYNEVLTQSEIDELYAMK